MRDLMSLVEAAVRLPLPDAMTVFPDAEVESILARGFDVGAGFGKRKIQYDPEAVEGLFADAEEEGRFKEGKHDRFQWLAKWLRGPRYRFIVQNIRSNAVFKNGLLEIERAITVIPATAEAIARGEAKGLGSYWSMLGGEPHWGHSAPVGSEEFFMLALVDPARADWATSIRRAANYDLGDDENEVFLPKGTPLTLVNIRSRGTQIEVTQPNQKA